MKLLIITQAVDTNDTTLGFMERWIQEISTGVEHVTVICLYKGEYSFSDTVQVYSLGKERGVSKFQYIQNFYSYIWKFRNEYDAVFVHMNQEYVLLGGFFWQAWGKKIFLWRNHPHGDILTRLAVFLSDRVFCTSPMSFTARFSKTHVMPVGIDTQTLYVDTLVQKKPHSLLVFGRISPVKHIDVVISALAVLRTRGVECTLSVVGDAPERDREYAQKLRRQVQESGLQDHVVCMPGVPLRDARLVYGSHEIYINVTRDGSFDKTIIEALACGATVLTSNTAMQGVLPAENICDLSAEGVAEKIELLFEQNEDQKQKHTQVAEDIVQKESLQSLVHKLFKEIK